jgi:uncharacterized Rossmann fold enzyme
MIYKNWVPIYNNILKDFYFQKQSDIESAELLNKLLNKKSQVSEIKLKQLIQNKKVVVFGAGSSLESSIIKHKNSVMEMIKIAADGTTTALIKHGILPEIITTDLDGNIQDQINSSNSGSIVIIHAH